MGITEQHTRRLIHEGALPARMRGKSWDVDDEAVRVLTSAKKGQHRNPRPRKANRPRLGAHTRYCWTPHLHRAQEAARIACCVFSSPSHLTVAELSPNRYLWKVSNPKIQTRKTWDDIERVITRFFIEQGLNSLSGVGSGRKRSE